MLSVNVNKRELMMNDQTLAGLLALPISFWLICGIILYCNYSEDINNMNWKQFSFILVLSGPFIWMIYVLTIILTLLAYLECPAKIIAKYFDRFYKYLGKIETKRIKCPYCNLKPLRSTIRRYGMCGLCHKHGRGYDNRRIK